MARNRLFGRLFAVFIGLFVLCQFTLRADDTSTAIFNPNFKTLQLAVNGNLLVPPILNLNAGDVLTVAFDELAEDRRFLRYSLVHCDADWKPSNLVESEYLDGFNIAEINDYEYSQATVVHYVHYRFDFPNEDIYVTKSGNYLVRIYDESEPEVTLLQARFYVCEYSTTETVEITSRTDIDYNKEHQQLSLAVDCTKSRVDNVFTDLKIKIMQNGRLDNVVTVTTPSRVVGRKAHFEHLRQLIFPAGNEYRRFENSSTYYPGMRVDKVEYHHPYYHATLFIDEPRDKDQYLFDKTQFGRFVVREYNSEQSDIEADYVVTHFSLEAPHYFDTDVYLDGDFLQRALSAESQMTYNRTTDRYEKVLLLKQGAYNYQYLAIDRSGKQPSHTAMIEGDKYQTINEYTIFVYTCVPGERYDRLVGAAIAHSDY